jgi:hypothetical protein
VCEYREPAIDGSGFADFSRTAQFNEIQHACGYPCAIGLMLNKLLDRSIAAVESRLVLLPPRDTLIPSSFRNVEGNPIRHAGLVADLQRLRGRTYLRDGALAAHELTEDGLHRTPEDEKSWHLVMLDKLGRVSACVWYKAHQATVTIDQLRVRHCPLATLPEWADSLRRAVEHELAYACREGLGFAEVGGWAVSESSRCTSEGLVLALGGYSLGRFLGGTLGMTTATVRHYSSTILRRLGGTDLVCGGSSVPSYYDPRYKCQMELLRFDSRHPTPKYARFVELLTEKLSDVLLIAPEAQATAEAA